MALLVLLLASEAAGDEDDGRCDQGQDSGDQHEPNAGAPISMADAVIVDIVLDDGEQNKVADHGNDGNNEGEERHETGDKGADNASADAQEESNEAQNQRDRVQDHDSGETLGRRVRSTGELGAVELVHDLGRVVTDVRLRARVIVTARKRLLAISREAGRTRKLTL